MRTTLDIPDPLFREIKSAAALRGESLKSFMLRAAQTELATGVSRKKTRIELPIVQSTEPTYDVSPERLAEVLDEEDHELSAGH